MEYMDHWQLALYSFLCLLAIGVVQYLVQSFLKKKDSLEAEKLDKIMQTVNRLELSVNKLVMVDGINAEKWHVTNNRIKDIEVDIKAINGKVGKIEVQIASLQP